MTRLRNAMLAVAMSVALGAIFHRTGSGVGLTAGTDHDGTPPALDAPALVATLHRINLMEIDAGKKAERQGASQVVEDYGRKLTDDHRAADEELKGYARGARLELDGAVPAGVAKNLDHARNKVTKLDDSHGAAFDHAFAKAMVRDQLGVIGLLDASRPRISDDKLRALIDGLERTLREHERIASNIVSGAQFFAAAAAGKPPSTAHDRRPVVR